MPRAGDVISDLGHSAITPITPACALLD